MLERVFDRKDELQLFMESNGNVAAECHDEEWTCDFAFLVDMTSH